MIYNWLIKHKKNAYGVAISFLIFTILVYAFRSCWFFRPLYEYIDYWALPLSAVFMLVLAYMAYISITEGRRIREEERERDFRRRCLDDIQDWAQKGAVLLVELRPWHIPEEQRQNLIRLAPLRAMNNWMMNASRIFDDRMLPRRVDEAAQSIKEYCEMLQGKHMGMGVEDMHERCRKSFVNLVEYVADLKVRLQL